MKLVRNDMITAVLMAVWFILVGITWLGWASISAPVLGGFALAIGCVWGYAVLVHANILHE